MTAPSGSGPYAQAAQVYRDANWAGALPILGKRVPPDGYTGYRGTWPSGDQVATWLAARGGDNIGLRLPDGVLGVDVDAYDGRRGLATIQEAEAQLGDLPRTWYSTSRDDGSGIRFFRVPEGRAWRSDLGAGSNVEIIRRDHRFAVVWPSVHPDTARTYRWYTPDGVVSAAPPTPAQLPELPEAWVEHLAKASGSPSGGASGADHSAEDAETFDYHGQAVDVDTLLREGVPPGEQNSVLYSYLCSMRQRGFKLPEMVLLGRHLVDRFENEPGKAPWTNEDLIEMVQRVRSEHPPGRTDDLSPEFRQLAATLAARQRGELPETPAEPTPARFEVAEPVPREPNPTDLGNTLRFVSLVRDRARYAVDEGRWYVWDGNRWEPDGLNRVMDLTKEVVDNIRLDALSVEDRDLRGRWERWARDSEAHGRRRAMVAGAESEPDLVITAAAFDRDPDLLVVRNGTVDLTTGELRESRRDDLCSRQAEVDFDPDAGCPRWKSHVRFVSKANVDLASYLRRAAGYTLTGSVGERSFFFLEGSGSNGKNAFIEPIMQVLGSYAQAGTSSMLTGGDEQHPTILADLLGARLVFVDETRQGRQLNVERVKALTGSKRIKARRMREDFFEFDAQFKLWIAGNGQPTIRDPSEGVWKRMHRVVCLGKVGEDVELIRDFGELLYREEAAGILNWMLEGLADWRRLTRLDPPASIAEAVSEYRDEEDFVGQFADDNLVRTGDPADVLTTDEVFARYQHWAALAGLRGPDLLNRTHLSRQLSGHGLERFHGRLEGGPMRRGFAGVRWVKSDRGEP